MMTSMMCSTMTSVMPERWMSRTRSIASCTSRCVRPAIASSSSRTLGSVASARAISSRLRPGVPSDRAGASASLLMPTRSSTARARASASARWEVRRNAPIITFSSTDMPSKVCGTWKVRARPSCARASGARLVMSWPSKNTLPDVDSRSPVRQLKNVDLPAPFGPDQAENVALLQRHGGRIDGLEAAKGLGHVAGFKEHGLLPPRLRPPRVLPRPAQSRLINVRMPPG